MCANSHYSAARAGDCSPVSCLDTGRSGMSNGTITPNASSQPESETESCQRLPSSAISIHSSLTGSPQAIRAWLISLPPDSPASPSPSPEKWKQRMTRETAGRPPLRWLESCSPNGYSWKTCQASLPGSMATLASYSKTWPVAGMMLRGGVYPLRKWERHISVIESGLWPTPTAGNAREGRFSRNVRSLAREAVFGRGARKVPTPTAGDCKRRRTSTHSPTWRNSGPTLLDYIEQLSGRENVQLNPRFAEYLMGWPLGWAALEPLGTDKFLLWRRQHGIC